MEEIEMFTEPSIGQIPTEFGTEGKFTGEYKIVTKLVEVPKDKPIQEAVEWKEIYKTPDMQMYESKTSIVIIVKKGSE